MIATPDAHDLARRLTEALRFPNGLPMRPTILAVERGEWLRAAALGQHVAKVTRRPVLLTLDDAGPNEVEHLLAHADIAIIGDDSGMAVVTIASDLDGIVFNDLAFTLALPRRRLHMAA